MFLLSDDIDFHMKFPFFSMFCIMVRTMNLVTREATQSKLWLVDLAGSCGNMCFASLGLRITNIYLYLIMFVVFIMCMFTGVKNERIKYLHPPPSDKSYHQAVTVN
ncbi:hypothetical protein KSP40_PGU010767 [Platanthera guangdongensis]|uniref:Uncharacterized protein n=1 Tax=Platanthera guangdongensis TaxID=2320717 RepID=A0ABR2M749_9ASPA